MFVPKNYLIIGITKNWYRAFEHNPPVWGLTERERATWDALRTGDIVYFYAAKEARGIIGKGYILNKFHSNDPYWPKEIETGIAKWKLHFYIQPILLLPPDMWRANKGPVASSEFGISGTSLQGKQIILLDESQVNKIEQKISSTWSIYRIGHKPPPQIHDPSIKYEIDSHIKLIEALEEIGKLQNFYPQTEFVIPEENRRIDVIWRREIRGAPTYAFEVELSGSLDKAINKLYRCYRLWSTSPRIITPSSEFSKVKYIASLQEPGFKDLIISITPEQIQDLYNKKKSYKVLEKEIRLL
jgi:hypothetical protein